MQCLKELCEATFVIKVGLILELVVKRGLSIGGSVVECSPATRATRVRFPADAFF